MTRGARARRAGFRLKLVLAGLACAGALSAGAGCKRDTTLGAPDSFLLVAPVSGGAKSKSGLPVVTEVEIDNPHAVPLSAARPWRETL